MTDPNDYIKTCPYCHGEFEARRIDQKFCSKLCKTRFNNHRGREARTSAAERNAITRPHAEVHWRNRQVLARYCNETVKIADLEKEGFQVGFITAFKVLQNKTNVFYVHDMRYVIKKDSYVIEYARGNQ